MLLWQAHVCHTNKKRKDLPDMRENQEAEAADFVKAIGTCSLWATWMELHEAMFCTEVPVLPLTVEKVFCVSACFKLEGYRAFKACLSKAKDMHVLAGHRWETQLDLAFRKAALSVSRGSQLHFTSRWRLRQSTSVEPCTHERNTKGSLAMKIQVRVGWGFHESAETKMFTAHDQPIPSPPSFKTGFDRHETPQILCLHLADP